MPFFKEDKRCFCQCRLGGNLTFSAEFGVTTRTIRKDIQALSPGYPIYTQQGGAGGIFIEESYKPYINTLSTDELKTLRDVYEHAEGEQKKILLQIIHKYGPDKLEI